MEDFSVRIKKAMSLRNIKQSELVEKTGINKGALSSYISGRYEPKQNNVFLIAKALMVSPSWLMGYDVEMTEMSASSSIPTWYSWKQLNSDDIHNHTIDIMNKVMSKHADDSDVIKLVSILSSYMTHIDNINFNTTVEKLDENKPNSIALNNYFELNEQGKKLVNDYIEMIFSKEEYVDDDISASTGKNGTGFYFYFKNMDKQ